MFLVGGTLTLARASFQAAVGFLSREHASLAVSASSLDFSGKSNPTNDNNEAGGGHFFLTAGQALFQAASPHEKTPPNIAMTTAMLLREAGESFCDIGVMWPWNWEAVTYTADDASRCFVALAQQEKRNQSLQKAYGGVAAELRRMSCLKDPSSSNVAGLAQRLQEAAEAMEHESSGAITTDLSRSLRTASQSVRKLAQQRSYESIPEKKNNSGETGERKLRWCFWRKNDTKC